MSGILCAALGAGGMVPAVAGGLSRGALQRQEFLAVAIGLLLVVAGACIVGGVLRQQGTAGLLVPAPVRAVMAANVLFLAFCAMETSDGLIYRGGRLVYWTSFLFLPALAMFYGQVLAQRWAWWLARGLAAIVTLWFVGFIFILPFANLRGASGPTPWYGRLYMAAVTLVFAGISAYVFHCLGRADARKYFGSAREANRACTRAPMQERVINGPGSTVV